MAYEPWQQRVFEERNELLERTKKLLVFTSADACLDLRVDQLNLLRGQLHLMVQLLHVLNDRIAAFDGEA